MKTLVAILFAACAQVLCGAEPFFKPNDVVALVGGEDMAVMRDYPALELLVLQQPGLSGVKFRNLAQEGDTVFEQFRDLNFPSWEEQLKKVGATVVLAQFGKMEALAEGEKRVSTFIAAYEKLLDRFAGDGRRVMVLTPTRFGLIFPSSRMRGNWLPEAKKTVNLSVYLEAIRAMAERRRWPFVNYFVSQRESVIQETGTIVDGVQVLEGVGLPVRWGLTFPGTQTLGVTLESATQSPLWPLLKQKNTLWFHYWRPQNWAFLAGDRTEQPSSRDHRDPTKRWFPAEMEGWLPLVEAKEKEIQTMIEASRKP